MKDQVQVSCVHAAVHLSRWLDAEQRPAISVTTVDWNAVRSVRKSKESDSASVRSCLGRSGVGPVAQNVYDLHVPLNSAN